MSKQILKFEELNADEQHWYLKETWCDKCAKADLGINEPVLYKKNGKTFIEGKCIICGEVQRSQIITKDSN